MTIEQIRQIADDRALPHETTSCNIVQTHASWVLLTDDFAYKFKRPVKYSFLDFSTPELRLKYLKAELTLNRRLTTDMYLDVLPVTESGGKFSIEQDSDQSIDHCLLMRRMDETRQMDLLLEQGQVSEGQVVKLAEVLVDFHKNAERISNGEHWETLYSAFADLVTVSPFLSEFTDANTTEQMLEIVDWSREFLQSMEPVILERNERGMIIDGHGDLHTRNIFLLQEPVIFDCIEFSEAFRHLDILSEVAFLVMDMERLGAKELASTFSNTYFHLYKVLENQGDAALFDFYKMHRAGVLVKVNCLRLEGKHRGYGPRDEELEVIRSYLDLLFEYYQKLRL